MTKRVGFQQKGKIIKKYKKFVFSSNWLLENEKWQWQHESESKERLGFRKFKIFREFKHGGKSWMFLRSIFRLVLW